MNSLRSGSEANSRHLPPRTGVPDSRDTVRGDDYVMGGVAAASHLIIRARNAASPPPGLRCRSPFEAISLPTHDVAVAAVPVYQRRVRRPQRPEAGAL